MYCRIPCNPSPSMPPGKVARASTGAPAQIVGSTPADRIERFERQSERVESRVTGGATRVGPVPLQHLAQRQVHLGLISRQLGNHRGRRRDLVAQYVLRHPVAALHRAGPQARRVLCQKRGHRQQAAPAVAVGVGDANPNALIARLPAACRSDGPEQDSQTCRGIKEVEDRTVVTKHVQEEANRLLEHRLSQFVAE